MKHEFVINIRKKYKIKRDEALRAKILSIILHISDESKYSIEAMKALLYDLEKIKYKEFSDYHFNYQGDEYVITTNCLNWYLIPRDVMTLEEIKFCEKRYPDEKFGNVEEHDKYFKLLL